MLVVQVGNYRSVFHLPFDFYLYIIFDLLHRRKRTFTHATYVFPNIECIISPEYFSFGNQSLLTNFQKLCAAYSSLTPLILRIFIERCYACSNQSSM